MVDDDPLEAPTNSESASASRWRDTRARAELRVTIAYHPELRRIGQQVTLDPSRARQLELSRAAPLFSGAPHANAPLVEPGVSRSPIVLTLDDDGGLSLSPCPRAFVDEQAIGSTIHIGPQRLARGFKLRLGGQVLLWVQLTEVAERGSTTPSAEEGNGGVDAIIGKSASTQWLRDEVVRVAAHDVPVLVLGESGTGKELVAEAIHRESARRHRPLVRVNMAAIPAAMAAAALFGHARGAFTGAQTAQAGYFEEADGGTLFMDEIGDTPLEVQNALLRVLALGEVQRVGDPKPKTVNVRLVAATDADVRQRVADGDLRLPLLMRLGGYELRVPALRERREDVPILLLHFLEQLLHEQGASHRLDRGQNMGESWLSRSHVDQLLDYGWPGNVRELHNVAQRFVVAHGDKAKIDVDELPLGLGARAVPQAPPSSALRAPGEWLGTPPPGSSSAPPTSTRSRRQLDEVSEAELRDALENNDHKPGRAAKALGVSRTSIYVLMERYPNIRKASDLTKSEIRTALEASRGNVNQAADALAVSNRALRLRMAALDIDNSS